ncbi:MAG: sulfatase [Deltaproteobacteria bacterium]|nr:sulfatase [Deltaproteobacteria bacterium]MBW2361154.1 sulfatase [Deltaproteobacteria bacterium]
MRWGEAACVLGLAAALGCSGAPARPHVVMVVFDTTRADHFSAYGYAEAKTPHFDALAASGVLFENAFATSSWTVPSHASLFTGLYPMTHGANQVSQYLAGEHETLAELLGDAGYETVAFSNNAWVGDRANLTQGFENVAEAWRLPGPGQAARTNKAIELWLDARQDERPFFLFVNYIEPHWPYDAPASMQARFVSADVSKAERGEANFGVIDWYIDRDSIDESLLPLRQRLYHAEVATVDQALGNLLRMLRDRGLEDASLVVAVSDHGENLGDNDHQGHSFVLYDSTLRVPLAIRPPGGAGAGTRRSEPVQLTDVFATVAAAAGVSAPGVGSDLLAAALPQDRPVVGEYYYPKQFIAYFPEEARKGASLAPYLRLIRSLRVGPHKLIWGSDGRHELYDVVADPRETRNLVADEPEVAKALERRLNALLEEHGTALTELPPPRGEMDPDVERSLRELGYVR